MNRLTKLLLAFITLTAAVYLLNAAVIFFTQPGNIQQGESVDVDAEYGTVSVALIEDLKAGGLGGLSVGTVGYVNVMSPMKVIYLDGTKIKNAPPQTSYLFKHEYAHILQKELVAQKAGGYPSYGDPIKSFIYYFYLFKLNNDLAALMPTDNHDATSTSPFTGLEVTADCYAQPLASIGHPMQYVGSVGCTGEQRYIAISLISGRWPDPLTPEEKTLAAERDTKRQADAAALQEHRKQIGNAPSKTLNSLKEIADIMKDIAEQHMKPE